MVLVNWWLSSCDERVIPQSKRPGKGLENGNFYLVAGLGWLVGLALRNDIFVRFSRQVKVIEFCDFRPPLNLLKDDVPNFWECWLTVSGATAPFTRSGYISQVTGSAKKMKDRCRRFREWGDALMNYSSKNSCIS
jgi:hypothetical protein